MNLDDIKLSEISQSQKTNTAWFHLYEVSRVIKFLETKGRMVYTRGRERGKWELFHWYRVSDLLDEKFWRPGLQQYEYT